MKRNIILLGLLIVIGVVLTGCSKEVKIEKDATKFREEYMSLNGEELENGKKIRELTISKKNRFIYTTAEEIVEKMENEESFIVYFGFAKCPWCRSVLEQLDQVTRDKKVDIYYVDILDIRDVKEIDEEGNITTTKEGEEAYLKLVELLDFVLEDYTLTKDDNKISAGEKRIYAPNVIAVSKGKAIELQTGISDELIDPYMELTDEIKKYAYNTFKCLIECIEEESSMCEKNVC